MDGRCWEPSRGKAEEMDPTLFPFLFFRELEQPNITYLVQQQQDRRKKKIVIRHLPEYFQKRLNKNIKEKKFIFF
jgi:hypothetical protein